MAIKRLGKYELLEELGRGGFGTVYRAHDTVLNVERAVKVLHPALTADPEFLGRFRSEAQMSARLEHAHIVPVYDLGEADGSVFLAMKYLPAGSLKNLLKREGKLSFGRAVEITRQIAAGLEYAHSRPEQLVHRDVKPGNILFEKDGSAHLGDFGFAKALQGAGSASLSTSGAMIGTPAYMPPEIWLGQGATPQSDQYSLACVVYEMLTGQALFGGGETPPPLVMKRHFDPLVLPAAWPEGVPEGVNAVLHKALAKERGERYAGMSEFARALEGISDQGAGVTWKGAVAGSPPDRVAEVRELDGTIAQEPVAGILRIEEHAGQEDGEKALAPVERTASPSYGPIPKKRTWWPWAGGAVLVVIVAVLAMVWGSHRGAGLTPTATLPAVPFATVVPTNTFIPSPTMTDTPVLSDTPATSTTPALGIGSTWVRPADGMVMVYVPAGVFMMGDTLEQAMAECQKYRTDCQQSWFTGEQPPYRVSLDAYWMDKTDVTNAMYAVCVKAGACQAPAFSKSDTRDSYYGNPQYDNYPVMYVNWDQAKTYCRWADARLPTEAEWEKAARGVDGRTYPWGNASPDKTLLNYNSIVGDTTAVGSYPAGASPYGALDMVGNVWQWVNDWYSESYYGQSPQSDPPGPTSGTYRVLRGGSWLSIEYFVRSAYRYWYFPSDAYSSIGFRCSRSLP